MLLLLEIVLYSDLNLLLSGVKFIVGKMFVLFDGNDVEVLCSDVVFALKIGRFLVMFKVFIGV